MDDLSYEIDLSRTLDSGINDDDDDDDNENDDYDDNFNNHSHENMDDMVVCNLCSTTLSQVNLIGNYYCCILTIIILITSHFSLYKAIYYVQVLCWKLRHQLWEVHEDSYWN